MTDQITKMIAWEHGDLDREGTIGLFQELLDSGLCWKLQGCYGCMASVLIEHDFISKPPEVTQS